MSSNIEFEGPIAKLTDAVENLTGRFKTFEQNLHPVQTMASDFNKVSSLFSEEIATNITSTLKSLETGVLADITEATTAAIQDYMQVQKLLRGSPKVGEKLGEDRSGEKLSAMMSELEVACDRIFKAAGQDNPLGGIFVAHNQVAAKMSSHALSRVESILDFYFSDIFRVGEIIGTHGVPLFDQPKSEHIKSQNAQRVSSPGQVAGFFLIAYLQTAISTLGMFTDALPLELGANVGGSVAIEAEVTAKVVNTTALCVAVPKIVFEVILTLVTTYADLK